MKSITSEGVSACRANGAAVIGSGNIGAFLVDEFADSLGSFFRAV
jgi:hypothetical protein